MKKYITLLSFVALFFVGMFSSVAQSDKPSVQLQANAKQQTYEMHQLVQLSGEQQSAVFKALVDANQNMEVLNKKKDVKSTAKLKGEVSAQLDKRLKAILTPEQYKTYQSSLAKKEKK